MSDNGGGDLKGFYMVLGAVGAIAVGAVGWSALQGTFSSAATVATASIVTGEIEAAGAHEGLWQYFAVLLPVKSVGVMGDARTYEHACALRVIESRDGMTADWTYLDHELLRRISNRIINEVRGINRVVLDISSKPPSTIEWE